jgi:hypothetical protein
MAMSGGTLVAGEATAKHCFLGYSAFSRLNPRPAPRKITLGVVATLVMAITILHSIVFLSIEPDSLSAAMPTRLLPAKASNTAGVEFR